MKKPLSYEDFVAIYSRVPRLNVELIIVSDQGVLLTKRAKHAWQGYWHAPGGTVYYGESFEAAVRRLAKEELGRDVKTLKLAGTVLYPTSRGQTEFTGWPMGIAYLVELTEGETDLNEDASEVGYFSTLPDNLVDDQRTILESALKGEL